MDSNTNGPSPALNVMARNFETTAQAVQRHDRSTSQNIAPIKIIPVN